VNIAGFCILNGLALTRSLFLVIFALFPPHIIDACNSYLPNDHYFVKCVGLTPSTCPSACLRAPASRYSENMQKHFMHGDDDRLPQHIIAYGDQA
jgi:hypothetical protein